MLIIKRYPNRKLYDTEAKQYITLERIAELIRQDVDLRVMDHASGEDLTALTLTQIILEQEKKKSGLLSRSALMGLIQAGEDRLNALQRALFSSMSLWHQVDEEIKRRIQALVEHGELSPDEGVVLQEKLFKAGLRQREESPGMTEGPSSETGSFEQLLKRHQLPTQADLKRLNTQLEELDAKLDEVSQTKP